MWDRGRSWKVSSGLGMVSSDYDGIGRSFMHAYRHETQESAMQQKLMGNLNLALRRPDRTGTQRN
jgi:hypothetical protein